MWSNLKLLKTLIAPGKQVLQIEFCKEENKKVVYATFKLTDRFFFRINFKQVSNVGHSKILILNDRPFTKCRKQFDCNVYMLSLRSLIF